MKILLVNPAFDGRAEVPPLGLLCLAAVLIDNGIDTRVTDLDVQEPRSGNDPCQKLHEVISGFGPSVLGVTSTSRNFDSARQVISCAKGFSPGIVCVLGGVHATVAYPGILENIPALDFLIRGEGEYSFLQLVRRLAEKRSFEHIEGLSFRSGTGIVHNPRGGPVDLNGHPMPAHHLIGNGGYRARSISAARGCFHGCTFCSIKEMYGTSVRLRAVASIVEEIHCLTTLGARRIMFTDDNFTADHSRVARLCGAINKMGLAGRAEYIAEGRLDDIARNPLTAQVLGESGFSYIYAGAESGSQRVLDYYRKKTTPEAIFEGAVHCLNNNVMPVVNFILLGPRDSVRTIRETILFARRLFESGAQIAYTETLVPYPGTPVRMQLAKKGRLLEKDGIYWFEPAGEPGYEEFISLFAMARETARQRFGHRQLFDQQRVYLELGCLDEVLSDCSR